MFPKTAELKLSVQVSSLLWESNVLFEITFFFISRPLLWKEMQSHSTSYHFFQIIKCVYSRFFNTVWKKKYFSVLYLHILELKLTKNFKLELTSRLLSYFLYNLIFCPCHFSRMRLETSMHRNTLCKKAAGFLKLSLIITFPFGGELIALWRCFRLKLWKSNIACFSCNFLTSPISHSF